MPAGRPNKPTALHLVQGTGRKHRMNPSEPLPDRFTPDTVPEPPEHIGQHAADAWRRLGPILAGQGLLTIADMLAFEQLACAAGDVREAQEAITAAGGPTYETRSTTGETVFKPRPEVAMLVEARRRLKGWVSDFGGSPSSRSRVTAQSEDGDDLAKYFSV